MVSIFQNADKTKRYRVIAMIDSNKSEEEIEQILNTLGFYHYSIEEELKPKFKVTSLDAQTS